MWMNNNVDPGQLAAEIGLQFQNWSAVSNFCSFKIGLFQNLYHFWKTMKSVDSKLFSKNGIKF